MKPILIYTKAEAKRNAFAIEKYSQNLGTELVILEYGLPDFKPSFVINRTNDFRVAKHYEELGIRVFNSSNLSKIANDKRLAYKTMSKNGIDILPIDYKKFPCVIKPADQKGGKGVRLLKAPEKVPEGYIVQKPASEIGKDLRVYVVGNDIKFAALRENKNGFLSNFCLGGNASEYKLSSSEISIVKKIISIIKPDFVGIDFLFNDGKLVFNEIEDSVGARMVYSLSNYDIIADYCSYIKAKIKKDG